MKPSVRRQASENAAALLRNPRVTVIPQSRETFLAGLELYRARPDKGYWGSGSTLHGARNGGVKKARIRKTAICPRVVGESGQ
jgi:hypothetical protein